MDDLSSRLLATSRSERKIMALANRLLVTLPQGNKHVLIADDGDEHIHGGSADYLILTGENKGERISVNYNSEWMRRKRGFGVIRDTVANAYREAYPGDAKSIVYLIDLNSRMARFVDFTQPITKFSTYLQGGKYGKSDGAIWFQMPIVSTHTTRDDEDESTDQEAVIEIRAKSVTVHILSTNAKLWSRDRKAVYINPKELWNSEKYDDETFHRFAEQALFENMPRWRLIRYFLTHVNPQLREPVVSRIRQNYGLISFQEMTSEAFLNLVQATVDFAIPTITHEDIGKQLTLSLTTTLNSASVRLNVPALGLPCSHPELEGFQWFLDLIARTARPTGYGGDRDIGASNIEIPADDLWRLNSWLASPARYRFTLDVDPSSHRVIEAGNILKDWVETAKISHTEKELAFRFLDDPAAILAATG